MSETLASLLGEQSRSFQRARCETVRQLPGNPYGIETFDLGSAVALKATRPGLRNKSRVIGFAPEHVSRIDEILDFYRKDGIACSLESVRNDFSSEQRRFLAARRVHPTGTCNVLAAVPFDAEIDVPDGARIVELAPSELDRYLDLYFSAHGAAVSHADELRQFERMENSMAGYHHYAVTVDGVIAAGAAMRIDGKLASGFNATTAPRFRGRGFQSALIGWRLREALRHGCTLCTACADVFSSSHRNLERAGFRYLCYGSTWGDSGI